VISPAVLAAASRPAMMDAYASVVAGVPGLVAYWRLGDTAAAVLADASGHGRDGSYPAPPAAFGAPRLTWDAADGRATNFGGAGFGQVAHSDAFALPRGTLSFYFKLNSLPSTQTLVSKGAGFRLQVLVGGLLKLIIGSTEFEMRNYAVPPIVVGTEYHVAVQWGVKRVRLYLDGRQVVWGMKHQSGLTGSDPWQIARSPIGNLADVVLDEVALWSRELSRAELDALSEYIRGLPYDPTPESSEVVSSAAALETAVNNAAPGHHILVVDGTYSLGTRIFTASGVKRRPIVIRPQNSRGNVAFTSPLIHMNGSWLVLANIFMTSPRIRSDGGHYNRVTRCRFRTINSQCIDVQPTMGNFWRIDHCDHSDYTPGNNRIFYRNGSSSLTNGYGKAVLIDHLYAHNCIIPSGQGGGANEIIAIGTTSHNALTSYPASTVERCLFTDVNIDGEGEIVHGKANDTVWDRLTFLNCASMYMSLRGGWHCQVVSVWFENIGGSSGGFNAWGPDHYIAGCRFASSAARVAPGGDTTLDARIAGGAGYPHALDTQIIGCVGNFSVGTIWNNRTPADFPATNTRIEACTGTITFGEHTGTTQSETADEPFTAAVKLTSSDVGMAADDPLVPDGWL
jgi:hypothetical protein